MKIILSLKIKIYFSLSREENRVTDLLTKYISQKGQHGHFVLFLFI